MKINKFKLHLSTKNIPNFLSFFRIFLVFPIIIFLEIDIKSYVWFLILLGGISDYLDGYLAKKLNLKTKFGAIIDPLADKVIILILFTWLCINQIIPYWSFSFIVIRELIISSLRSSKHNGMPAIDIGKYKSFLQFLSILFLFYPLQNALIFNLGLLFYWISFILCIFSLFIYLRLK